MKNLVTLAVLLQLCTASITTVVAQEKKAAVDPSGTWRWVFDGNGNSIDSALSLDSDKEGNVTGTLTANDRAIKVLDGKIKGDALAFRITFEMESREITGMFQGKIDGDKVKGDVAFKTDDGEQEMPWEATRSVEASDLVGVWDMKVDTPNGETKSVLTVVDKDGKLSGMAKSENGDETEVLEMKIEKNELHYKMELDYEGAQLNLVIKGRPYGSKIKGKMEYSVDGNTGELDFSGTRRTKAEK